LSISKLLSVVVLCYWVVRRTLCSTHALLESHSWATGEIWIARWSTCIMFACLVAILVHEKIWAFEQQECTILLHHFAVLLKSNMKF